MFSVSSFSFWILRKRKIRGNGNMLENHKGNVKREGGEVDFSNVGHVQFGQLFGRANLQSRVISFVTESRGKMEAGRG